MPQFIDEEVHAMRAESLPKVVGAGALIGVVAGVTFAMFEMVVAWAMGDGFWMPLRMIGAIALGEGALESSYSLAGAATVGALVHLGLSAVYGAIFGALLGFAPMLRTSVLVLVAAGALYGLALWLVNFYVVAPLAFPWFENANAAVQFVAHVFFFGALVGLLFGKRSHPAPMSRREPVRA